MTIGKPTKKEEIEKLAKLMKSAGKKINEGELSLEQAMTLRRLVEDFLENPTQFKGKTIPPPPATAKPQKRLKKTARTDEVAGLKDPTSQEEVISGIIDDYPPPKAGAEP